MTLELLAKGKVREIYDLGGELLMVASDRISTYDVVHPTEIPDKGKVLTGLSVVWFDLTREIVPNHLLSATDGVPAELRGRALRVKRLRMLPVECVVRGYITGSGWKDYQATGAVSGIAGAGGVLSQPVPAAQSRTYCLSKEACGRPGSYSSAGQKREESGVQTSSPSTSVPSASSPNSNFVSARITPRSRAWSAIAP